MSLFSEIGSMFGFMALFMLFAAFKKIHALEVELKRRNLLDADFGESEEEEEKPISDPGTWSAAKKARVTAARRKVWVARLKIAPIFAVPIVLIVLELSGVLR
jgi:hypothetical protein